MASKALLVLALLLAATFLVASANEQAQATKEEKKAEVQDWHGGGSYPGGGGGWHGGGGYPGGGNPGGHCQWGCCNRHGPLGVA
ncbi:glycine-rich cell wall structural protein-like [Miscanthus floridulus]|uniref:glycine-rich cell wall structural protein-like n=1 Tax=Miscanthus floridulus TaxID=154761 RepID=UPI003457ED78